MASIRLILPGFALVASTGVAQRGGTTVVAHVLDMRDGSLVPSAEVAIAGTRLRGRSDSAGRAVIPDVPAGSYALQTRRLGYKAATTKIVASGQDSVDVVVALNPTPQAIAGVKVTETAAEIHLREFEARLRNHIGGYFITDSVLRRSESDGIENLLHARVPGIRAHRTPDNKVIVWSSRGQTSLKADKLCQVEVFLDGTRLSDGDANLDPLFDIAGIEYYPAGYVPPQYRFAAPVGTDNGGAQCGVLLLWTRP